MMNLMKINNINAVIKYDPEIEMFRGEFVGLMEVRIFMLRILKV